ATTSSSACRSARPSSPTTTFAGTRAAASSPTRTRSASWPRHGSRRRRFAWPSARHPEQSWTGARLAERALPACTGRQAVGARPRSAPRRRALRHLAHVRRGAVRGRRAPAPPGRRRPPAAPAPPGAGAPPPLLLPPPGPAPVWTLRARRLVARNGLGDATVRLTITRGTAGDFLVPDRAAPPTQLLTV